MDAYSFSLSLHPSKATMEKRAKLSLYDCRKEEWLSEQTNPSSVVRERERRDPLVNSLKLSIQPIEDQNVILLTQTYQLAAWRTSWTKP